MNIIIGYYSNYNGWIVEIILYMGGILDELK
jgi:hypothetical protein